MRILVTGGAGFIGSNLTHALVAAGEEVTVVDDLSHGSPDNLHPSADFRRLDILDPEFADLVAATRPEAIVHLAAQTDVQTSIADPDRDRAVNVGGTRAVAQAALAAGSTRVLSASSAAVYGTPQVVPTPETAAKAPENPYGVSKLEAEAALADTLEGTGTDFASLRFSNVFGPRQDWSGEGGVVAIFAHMMSRGEPPTIYGDGTQTRDFVFVGDIVGAIMAALDHAGQLAGPGADGPAYNISTGRQTSVLELAGILRVETRFMKEFVHEPARSGDIERSALDPGKAALVFGFTARANLEAALSRTVRWFATEG